MWNTKRPQPPRSEGPLTFFGYPHPNFGHFSPIRHLKLVERFIYTPRPFIWAYKQVSMTLRSKVLARTGSYILKNRCLWTFWPYSANFRWQIWSKLSKSTPSQDLIFEPITKSLSPFVQKFYDVALKRKRWQTDGQMDTPTLWYRPPTLGCGLIMWLIDRACLLRATAMCFVNKHKI